jgi:hypothetical protein
VMSVIWKGNGVRLGPTQRVCKTKDRGVAFASNCVVCFKALEISWVG